MLLMVIKQNVKAKEIKIKKLSPKEYLDMIKPYLRDMINDHKALGVWKTQLTMLINLFLIQILMRPVLGTQRVIIQKL